MTSDSARMHPDMRKAIDATRESRFDDALTCLTKIVMERPGDQIALGMLASVYAELGMKERAREYYERVLSISPENPLARFQRGLLDYEEAKYEAALDIWQPLLDIEADFMGRFFSALARIQLGQQDDVGTLLQQASERMPANHPLREQVAKLLLAQE